LDYTKGLEFSYNTSMSKTSLKANQPYETAQAGLVSTTKRLKSFYDEESSWFNPQANRQAVIRLIAELVSYYQAFDRYQIAESTAEIEAARVAIFDALIATSEDAQERGKWQSEEMDSRRIGFETLIDRLGYEDVAPYQVPEPRPAPKTAPTPALAPVALKPQGPTFWQSCKSFFSAVWNAVKSFCQAFVPDKPKKVVVVAPSEKVKSPPLRKREPEPIKAPTSLLATQRDLEREKKRDKREYQRKMREFEVATQNTGVPNLQKKQFREPGTAIVGATVKKRK
jgi:hypothetical protein